MPRLPRIDLAGVPHHLVQRGNDRLPCFFECDDYRRYLTLLREIILDVGCAVHAYVLMTNHVHLLVAPSQPGQLSRIMQTLGRRYVRYINDRHRRTGTLWEGRFKSCPVASGLHLLRCYRYIELNPVRAAMVAEPSQYEWSSFHANALGKHDPLVRGHADYLALAVEQNERCAQYRKLVMDAIDSSETDAIRRHLQSQHAYGPKRFCAAIEAQLGRRVGPAKIGRPSKKPLGDDDKRERLL